MGEVMAIRYLTDEERLAWSRTKNFRHKKRGVAGMRLSGPSKTSILILFSDRKKATWVQVDSVEPMEDTSILKG